MLERAGYRVTIDDNEIVTISRDGDDTGIRPIPAVQLGLLGLGALRSKRRTKRKSAPLTSFW